LAAQIALHPDVARVLPFVSFDTLVMRGGDIETAGGVGAVPDTFEAGGSLRGAVADGAYEDFVARDDGLLLGAAIARRLGATPGDRLTLIVPGGAGNTAPRHQVVVLSGVLSTGTELDEAVALVNLPLASRLAGLDGGISGFRVQTHSLFDAQRTGWELSSMLPAGFYSTNWMMTHGNLYAAIQLSRDLVSLLLFSIIAVAAFNVVSSLVLVVMDKQGNIAILRTMGASGADIAWVFLLQGGMIGLVGVVLGGLLGALGSQLVAGLVSHLERALDIRFLNTDVYPVSFLPVDLLARDVVVVGAVALVMCLVAAIYPARRAARLAPASILSAEH
ncbi:MAG: FtsX-like permease family protein, partial [Halioglobus sp.]